MNEQRYLLDAVTLIKMTPQQRGSAFVRQRCRVPSEVLYEARLLPDAPFLAELEYAVTAQVLENIKVVMASLTASDTLIDLYTNTGNGDVLLLASARTLMEVEAQNLFGDRWLIATDDKELRAKANELTIATCSSAELLGLVDVAPELD